MANNKYFSNINKDLKKSSDFIMEDEAEYESLEIYDGAYSGSRFASLDFKDCLLKNCNFNQFKVSKLSLLNVRLEDCDLANFETEELYIKNCDFIKCRMTGFLASEGIINDSAFTHCQLKFSQFRFAKLKQVEFDACPLCEADFYSANFYKVNFSQCDLAKAEMLKTFHSETDLRTSIISGLGIDIESLKGVTVDHSQVNDLLWLLGVTIK